MRVDFYEMGGRFRDPLEVVCILAGKAWPDSAPVAIVGPRSALDDLDRRLWQTPSGRFLPHGIDDPAAPIVLGETAPDQAAVVINLDPESPLPEGRYERVLEIVPPTESARPALRKRWKDWKERGAEVHHHTLR